jgi:hypothetical protein
LNPGSDGKFQARRKQKARQLHDNKETDKIIDSSGIKDKLQKEM